MASKSKQVKRQVKKDDDEINIDMITSDNITSNMIAKCTIDQSEILFTRLNDEFTNLSNQITDLTIRRTVVLGYLKETCARFRKNKCPEDSDDDNLDGSEFETGTGSDFNSSSDECDDSYEFKNGAQSTTPDVTPDSTQDTKATKKATTKKPEKAGPVKKATTTIAAKKTEKATPVKKAAAKKEEDVPVDTPAKTRKTPVKKATDEAKPVAKKVPAKKTVK